MWLSGGAPGDGGSGFACVSMADKSGEKFSPTAAQLLKHPFAMAAMVPRNAALFGAGAISGAAPKSVVAPLDCIKLLMQTHGIRAGQESATKAVGFIEQYLIAIEIPSCSTFLSSKIWDAGGNFIDRMKAVAFALIGKQEGIKGYWKGNLPQVIRIVPCRAVQLFAYET
ncbi:thylakoid ATP/ADP carrier [Actinidia rufa]|uniref:Thylakoid ATP/ADP carrier n=1 Tax=Actinidia rufa TaxID=165716 RepID=A0A7J0EBT3_9ERIC|nr:thylakoid ATP/ADP carrier [Actinidia rufa]